GDPSGESKSTAITCTRDSPPAAVREPLPRQRMLRRDLEDLPEHPPRLCALALFQERPAEPRTHLDVAGVHLGEPLVDAGGLRIPAEAVHREREAQAGEVVVGIDPQGVAR